MQGMGTLVGRKAAPLIIGCVVPKAPVVNPEPLHCTEPMPGRRGKLCLNLHPLTGLCALKHRVAYPLRRQGGPHGRLEFRPAFQA